MSLEGHTATGLAPKTIAEVHMIVRAALDLAVRRELVGRNVADHEHLRLRVRHAVAASGPLGAGPIPRRRRTTASTRPCTSPRTPACVAARSSDSSGPTSTPRHDCRSRRTIQSVGGRPVEFGVKTRTSRRTVELDHDTVDLLAAGDAGSNATTPPRRRRLDVLQHRTAGTSTPNRSASCSTGSSPEPTSRGSGSTTCATPTPRCSSPTASPSRSSPNASATPTPPSPCTPTNTCSPA